MSLRLFFFALLLAYVYGQDLDYGGIFDTNFGASPTPTTTTTVAPKPSAIPHRTNVQPNPAPTESPPQACENGGECVPYYLCLGNAIITDGEGIIDIRFDEEQPPPCKDYMLVCCGSSDVSKVPIVPENLPEFKAGCGHRNLKGVGGFQIAGASMGESEFGEFPWMVAILKETKVLDQILNVYQCGGSLIHPSVVLTAGHCVYGKQASELKIRAGEWDTQTKNEIYAHQDRDVVSFVMHEQYTKASLNNNVALLFLSEPPLELAPNIATVCLPPQDYNFDNLRCLASGWGKDIFGKEGKYQVILKKIELPTVPFNTCQANLRTTRLGARFILHNSFMCAGGEKGKDTCKGDGGSPLVCPIAGMQDRYYQAGVVSWGIGCGENQIPGVYGKISAFRKWIDQHFAAKGLDTGYYTV